MGLTSQLRTVRDWLIGPPPPRLPLYWWLEGAVVRGAMQVVGYAGVMATVAYLWLVTNGWLALAGGSLTLWLVVSILNDACDTYDDWAAERQDRVRVRRHARRTKQSRP